MRKFKTVDEVRGELNQAYLKAIEHGGWRAVAREFGVTGAMAFRIATQGYEPKEAHIRVRLGLSAMVAAPACAKCGEVHVTRRCRKEMEAVRPNRAWRDRSVEEVRWALVNREEMQDGE